MSELVERVLTNPFNPRSESLSIKCPVHGEWRFPSSRSPGVQKFRAEHEHCRNADLPPAPPVVPAAPPAKSRRSAL